MEFFTANIGAIFLLIVIAGFSCIVVRNFLDVHDEQLWEKENEVEINKGLLEYEQMLHSITQSNWQLLKVELVKNTTVFTDNKKKSFTHQGAYEHFKKMVKERLQEYFQEMNLNLPESA